MLAHLVPDGVDVGDLVLQKHLIGESTHDLLDLLVRGSHKDAASLLDLILSLTEVVVELVNKLVTFVDGCDVSLSTAVTLCLDHNSSLL